MLFSQLSMEDVKLMVEIGLDVYRLSISWSRLIPNGEGPINPKGLQFYNNSRGDSTIEPYLAVHHIFLSHFSVVRLYRRKYKMKTGQPLKEPVIFLLVGKLETFNWLFYSHVLLILFGFDSCINLVFE
ncbi:hydroxyisourate hydrolase isoform X3 [Arachis hypogaea]|nr:beta-glucosidase 20 isoform X6 [Arachis hypogaea]XP_025623345.1 beta-glucosidase 20 isoform X6 [Arachis hypogaea]XP_025623346.1 beta-glucosidase 20 isoform X6 [Arachis hypogaea]XP_025623347.1 beta-glucosidase 20 isoform X6 [Arachis hypogaea]XP_025623348.1 beta-glucosidase 20 isoform X6 [Arachis hypogaea]